MAVKINNISYSGFFYDGEALTAMYLNGNKVYGGGEHAYDPLIDSKYFVVKANSATTLSVLYQGSPTITIHYKKNGEDNWTTITGNTNVILQTGDYLEMKGDVDNTGSGYVHFGTNSSGNIDVGGCLMALIFGGEISSAIYNQFVNTHTFYRLFDGCTGLVSAEHLTMASNTTQGCYQLMFNGCTSLVTAPSLPATEMTDSCYRQMFQNCTNLVNPPSLPATTLASGCYQGMFNGCTKLTTAPVLSATEMTDSCYREMFNGCTSLVTAPSLPATTLTSYCYRQMFQNCTNLVNPPSLPATTLASYCYREMFAGCTSLTNVPDLPCTNPPANAYYALFKGCTVLVNGPEIMSTSTVSSQFPQMFSGCTSLTNVTVHLANGSKVQSNWLAGVNTTGTLYCPSTATGTFSIPSTWTLSKTLSS